MSSLSKKDVEHVARLAKLTLTPTEITKFQRQLSEVISHFDELAKLDTSEVEPTSQTTGLTNVTREDKRNVLGELSQEEAISPALNAYNGYFLTKAVIDQDA